ncbi:MAG: copper-binding protein, partial [Thaumarchaeota archaeon]|nr:copper-binding protein [Nitrososphaerota archaeon]
IGFSCLFPASAQTASIKVTTNQPTYADGDQMVISGTVSTQLNVPISIVVRDPSNNIVLIGQVTPNQDDTFSTTVTAGGGLWTATGTYEVDVTYGSKDNTAKATFQFVGSSLTVPITIQGQTYNATYKITNGKVLGIVPTQSANSLTIRIQPSGAGILSITLPRSLIDAKQNGQDNSYLVQDDGVSTAFNETRTDTVSRTLAIPFESKNTGITIIGTQIVPEFNTVPILILTLSMITMVFYLRSKSRITI